MQRRDCVTVKVKTIKQCSVAIVLLLTSRQYNNAASLLCYNERQDNQTMQHRYCVTVHVKII